VEHDVTWSDVEDGEAHGQRSEAAVVGTTEGRVLLEHSAVQMYTDVRSRSRRTIAQYLNS